MVPLKTRSRCGFVPFGHKMPRASMQLPLRLFAKSVLVRVWIPTEDEVCPSLLGNSYELPLRLYLLIFLSHLNPMPEAETMLSVAVWPRKHRVDVCLLE